MGSGGISLFSIIIGVVLIAATLALARLVMWAIKNEIKRCKDE